MKKIILIICLILSLGLFNIESIKAENITLEDVIANFSNIKFVNEYKEQIGIYQEVNYNNGILNISTFDIESNEKLRDTIFNVNDKIVSYEYNLTDINDSQNLFLDILWIEALILSTGNKLGYDEETITTWIADLDDDINKCTLEQHGLVLKLKKYEYKDEDNNSMSVEYVSKFDLDINKFNMKKIEDVIPKLEIIKTTETTISIKVTTNTESKSKIKIYVSDNDKDYSYYGDVDNNSTCTIDNLEKGKKYYFKAKIDDDNDFKGDKVSATTKKSVTVENPKTGIEDNLLLGFCIVVFGTLITTILRSNKLFKKL